MTFLMLWVQIPIGAWLFSLKIISVMHLSTGHSTTLLIFHAKGKISLILYCIVGGKVTMKRIGQNATVRMVPTLSVEMKTRTPLILIKIFNGCISAN